VLTALSWMYARTGRKKEALEIMAQVDQRRAFGWQGMIYAALGDIDRSFEFMERAVQTGGLSNAVFYLKVFPWYDPLRSDPRFKDLLRHMNLPE
jgi:hypothetical protein